MPKVLDLKTERARVVNELRALIDTAENENRDLTGEEQQTEQRLDEQITELDNRIKRQERLEREELDGATIIPDPSQGTNRSQQVAEFRTFFSGQSDRERTFARGETRDTEDPLETGTDSLGGHTIADELVTSLYEEMQEFSVIREANPTVLTTSAGHDLLIPKTDGFSQASIVGEGGTIGKSNPTFQQVRLGAFKYAFILVASRELIQDTQVSDLLGFFASQGGRALGDASGAHFVNGSGTGQPEGVLTAATVGHTTTATDAVTADDFLEMYHAVIRAYRARATWLVNDSTLLAARKLKDGNDQYIWQPGLQAGEPDRLLGRPILPDPHVPALDADTKVAAFGDMAGYYIRDVGSVEVVRSDEYAFDTDQVAWRFIVRTDGRLVDTAAVKALQTAAS